MDDPFDDALGEKLAAMPSSVATLTVCLLVDLDGLEAELEEGASSPALPVADSCQQTIPALCSMLTIRSLRSSGGIVTSLLLTNSTGAISYPAQLHQQQLTLTAGCSP